MLLAVITHCVVESHEGWGECVVLWGQWYGASETCLLNTEAQSWLHKIILVAYTVELQIQGEFNFFAGMYVYGWGESFVHGSVGIHVPFIYIIHDRVLLIIRYCTELASPRCVVLCASTSEQLAINIQHIIFYTKKTHLFVHRILSDVIVNSLSC